MKFKIRHRYTGAVLFEAEVGSFKACVELAVKSYADLRNADLSYTDLSYADLWHANLSNADLWHANLSNANLSNANLRNANLSNANLSNTDLWNANLSNCCYKCAGVGGKHRRIVMCNPELNLVQAGCFKGSLSEFKQAVIDKYGEDYGSYKGVVAYLEAEIKERGER